MLRSRRLLAAALLSAVASASCATGRSSSAPPDVRARAAAVRRVGLVSPRVAALEEDSIGAMQVDASHVVRDLGDAFAAELVKHGTSVVRIAPDDPDAIAASERFAASGGLGVGAVPALATRYGVDAVWLVQAETVRSAGVRGGVAMALTLPFGPFDVALSWQAARASVRTAVVDASGTVLFSCSLDDLPPEGPPTDGDDGSPRALAADLQDPGVAWAYAAAAVRAWRKAAR
jgi:hypothetical protein